MTKLAEILMRDESIEHEHYECQAQVDRRELIRLVDELAQALLKYGRHKHDCQMYGLHQCTCGWYGEYLKRDEIIRSLARATTSDASAGPK